MNIPLRQVITKLAIAGFAAVSVALLPVNAVGATQRPNIVYIMADDLGWTDLSHQGSEYYETPNIDAFAQSGLRFTRFYSSAPVCTPTRGALMTGKYPARLHLEAVHGRSPGKEWSMPEYKKLLPSAEITLAEMLKEAGYATASIGKWHLGNVLPQEQGFDVNVAGNGGGAAGSHWWPYAKPMPKGRYAGLEEEKDEYLADRLTRVALEWLDTLPEDQPFFLYLSHYAVHTPIESRPDYEAHFAGKEPDGGHKNPTYAGMIKSLDDSVGKVLDYLEEHGLADNTIVVFTSDNGGLLKYFDGEDITDNSPLREGKKSLYEGGIRVPCVWRVPGMTPAGATTEVPSSTVDHFPTLCALAKVDIPETLQSQLDGADITETLADPDAGDAERPILFHAPYWHSWSGLIQGDWKIVQYLTRDKTELYNLAEDIGETRDLSASNPEQLAEMKALLDQMRESVNARMPVRKE